MRIGTNRFTYLGADNRLDVFAVWNGSLYAGGRFTAIGGVAASRIARWDGTRWTALGEGVSQLGSGAQVTALLPTTNGLIVGGSFARAGGVSATNIARWDGTQWSSLGHLPADASGVYALEEVNGQIYAGGGFRTAQGAAGNNIARWNGSQWQPVGTGVNGTVWALERIGNVLYVGGSFSSAGGLSNTVGIARWDGLNWSPLLQGINAGGEVLALAARGLNLYVGGRFNRAGPIAAPGLALWYDDTSRREWLSVSPSPVEVYGLRAVEDRLYVGGRFAGLGGTTSRNIALLGPTNWVSFGTGLTEPSLAQVSAVEEFNGNVFAGGNFQQAGGANAPFVARWDGAAWRNPGPTNGLGFDNHVQAVTFVGTNLYALGAFTRAGSVPATGIARWTGDGWATVGGGLPAVTFGKYYAESDGQNLYAGADSGQIRRWNGSTWTTLPFGATGPIALSGTNLYAVEPGFGGTFVVRWTGSAWARVGTNFINTITPTPLILSLIATGDVLYAAGYFQRVGNTPALNVAKWTGSQWQGLGAGIDFPGLANTVELALHGNDLLVGTIRNSVGGLTGTNSIRRWNGSAWSVFPGEFTGGGAVWLNDIVPVGNEIYVAGRFSHVNGQPSGGVARWDGAQWNPLGGGVNDMALGLAVREGSVYVGGQFAVAGTNASSRFAIFRGGPSAPSVKVVIAGANLRVSWPSTATGYVLESTTSLPSNWQPITTGITDDGTTKTYAAPIDRAVRGQFYRLRQP